MAEKRVSFVSRGVLTLKYVCISVCTRIDEGKPHMYNACMSLKEGQTTLAGGLREKVSPRAELLSDTVSSSYTQGLLPDAHRPLHAPHHTPLPNTRLCEALVNSNSSFPYSETYQTSIANVRVSRIKGYLLTPTPPRTHHTTSMHEA